MSKGGTMEISKDGKKTLSRVGDEYVMAGGRYGEHRLSVPCTDAARLKAHWQGYCQADSGWTLNDVVRAASDEPDHSIPYDGCVCGDAFCDGCERN